MKYAAALAQYQNIKLIGDIDASCTNSLTLLTINWILTTGSTSDNLP